jgi:hypothetical protein
VEDGGGDGELKVEREEECGSVRDGGAAGGVEESPSSCFKNLSMTNTQGDSGGSVEEADPLLPPLPCHMAAQLDIRKLLCARRLQCFFPCITGVAPLSIG